VGEPEAVSAGVSPRDPFSAFRLRRGGIVVGLVGNVRPAGKLYWAARPAGPTALRVKLAAQRVAIIDSGGNVDRETLRRVTGGEIV
jgi:hypothetical protein